MSADADRQRYCAHCRYLILSDGRCINCHQPADPMPPASANDAARIATLEAELADARSETKEARRERDEAEDDYESALNERDEAVKWRDTFKVDLLNERAALKDTETDLRRERAAHERTKAELAQARAEVVNHLQRTAHVEFERDAAQAEAAAIQLAYHSFKAKWLAREVDAADIGELEVVIYGGGRALAARVPLWRELQRAVIEQDWRAMDDMASQLAALDEKGGTDAQG